MKKPQIHFYVSVPVLFWSACLILMLTFSGCKKDPISEGDTDTSAVEQLSNDENTIENALDDVMVDAEGVVANGAGQFKNGFGSPCNATLDSIGIVHDSILIRITYNGLNCRGTHTRTGKVEIRRKIMTHWGMSGSSISIRYIDFTITRISNGKSITLNGIKVFQNVSGGALWQLGISRNIVIHRVSGNLDVTFDDGATKNWNVARQCTFSGTQENLVLTVDGFGSSGGNTNLVAWGTTRNGAGFYTQISQSVVHRQTCQFDPVAGIKIHRVPSASKSATLTFGYNDNNEPVNGMECPTRFRLDWTHGSHSGTKYLVLQ